MTVHKPDVFLDRDGVILRSPDERYVTSWRKAVILPGALQAMRKLTVLGHRLIVVTNQSAVGRGIMTMRDVDDIHRHLSEVAARKGASIAAFLVCPHRPEDGCECRKPKPGLLLQARDRLGSDLETAFVVGDQLCDIEAAQAAGTHAVLVLSGNTLVAPQMSSTSFYVAADLNGAVDLIRDFRSVRQAAAS